LPFFNYHITSIPEVLHPIFLHTLSQKQANQRPDAGNNQSSA